MSYTIGIDLGGSCVKAVVVTPDGKTLTNHNLPFDGEADMEWANRLRELVQSIEEGAGLQAGQHGFFGAGAGGAGWQLHHTHAGTAQGACRLELAKVF